MKSFEYSLILILAQLPGYVAAAWLIEKLGRKTTLALFMAACAVCAYFFGGAGSEAEIIVFFNQKEHAVLKMLCMGLSNQEMADQTFCSITTIKTHVSHILYKTDCKSRQQLISKYHAQTLKSVPMP